MVEPGILANTPIVDDDTYIIHTLLMAPTFPTLRIQECSGAGAEADGGRVPLHLLYENDPL